MLSTDLKDYASGKGAKQYTLDLISSFVLLQAGFINHPRYNELVESSDPKVHFELVRDEFRQLNTYMVERCIQTGVHREERYNHPGMRHLFLEYGQRYADLFFQHQTTPDWDIARSLFDELMKEHYNV